jgi:putative copper export protein
MSNDDLLSRRAFTVESVLAILATATITITGCGGGIDLGPSAPAGSREGVVSNNHGHRAIVEAAQLSANSTVTIDMRFRATHNHTLVLTPLELASISENGHIVKISSSDEGHNHTVTFN